MKIDAISMIDGMSGKLNKKEKVVFSKRYGNIHAWEVEHTEKDPTATKFDTITFDEVYNRNLKVMDMTAFTLCKENGLDIIVFDMDTEGNLAKVLNGETIGTLVCKE